MERRVILAAGHLPNTGARARGHVEGADNIAIVNSLEGKLRSDGRLEVLVIPHALDYVDQVRWVNKQFRDRDDAYCAEVHKNSGGGTGVEAWYLTGSTEGERQAGIVLGELSRVSRLRSRGTKPDEQYRGKRLHWLRATKPWAGLFECGFIDRDHFRNDLYAEGLFRGLLKLFGLTDSVQQLYRVVRFDGTQVGAYRVRSNAWAAFLRERGNARILGRNGIDVTAEFVDEFGRQPIGVTPAPEPVDEPPVDQRMPGDEGEDFVHDDPVLTDEEPDLLPEDETEEVVVG